MSKNTPYFAKVDAHHLDKRDSSGKIILNTWEGLANLYGHLYLWTRILGQVLSEVALLVSH